MLRANLNKLLEVFIFAVWSAEEMYLSSELQNDKVISVIFIYVFLLYLLDMSNIYLALTITVQMCGGSMSLSLTEDPCGYL